MRMRNFPLAHCVRLQDRHQLMSNNPEIPGPKADRRTAAPSRPFRASDFFEHNPLADERTGSSAWPISVANALFFLAHRAVRSNRAKLRVWRGHLSHWSITVNAVAPGAIQTDFSGGMVRDNPELNKQVAESIALGRAGVPDDIGPMIAALLSDANRWAHAQRIAVSGGMAI